ncbi:hypothetical protein BGZ65_002788 [Modicella reniformis]|uniref:Ricin B lectin domain-containing protein n=1 Tax=Modicella reniformis TaxID=1440133 RepID=A0A9P6ILK5_9FUNG|nr:hypothetical protein BGZ65_002788 [Modicella reniformis]
MVGRSLLSLLAVATVAMQCVAAIEDGVYRISTDGGQFLTVQDIFSNTPLMLQELFKDSPTQKWRVKNVKNTAVSIQNIRTNFYVAPKNTKAQGDVIQSEEEFHWQLQPKDGKFVIAHTSDTSKAGSLVISRSPEHITPAHVNTQQDGKVNQEWNFSPLDAMWTLKAFLWSLRFGYVQLAASAARFKYAF